MQETTVKVLPLGSESHEGGGNVWGPRAGLTHVPRLSAKICCKSVSARALATCVSLQIGLRGLLLQRGLLRCDQNCDKWLASIQRAAGNGRETPVSDFLNNNRYFERSRISRIESPNRVLDWLVDGKEKVYVHINMYYRSVGLLVVWHCGAWLSKCLNHERRSFAWRAFQ